MWSRPRLLPLSSLEVLHTVEGHGLVSPDGSWQPAGCCGMWMQVDASYAAERVETMAFSRYYLNIAVRGRGRVWYEAE